MVTRDRIKQVVNVLQKVGRVQKNQLIRIIEKEGLMSHQTANDAIDEAVKSNRIFRQDDFKGKQKIVWLSVTDDFLKLEDSLKRQIEMSLNTFDSKFEDFEKIYPELSIEQKADGLDVLVYHFRSIIVAIEHLHDAFGKTRFWENLTQEVRLGRLAKFGELAASESDVNRMKISSILLSYKFEDIEDSLIDVEAYFSKIK